MICDFSSLTEKEVVNIRDGKILGSVSDMEIDICTGRILRIILPAPGKFSIFSSPKNCLYIPWDHIEKIGDDTILVKCGEFVCKK